jgi:hypothetical protein
MPDRPDFHQALGECTDILAASLVRLGRPNDALPNFREAFGHLGVALRSMPKDAEVLASITRAATGHAEALVAIGDHEGLAKLAEEVAAIPSDRWEEPFRAAGFLGRAVGLAGKDGELEEVRRNEIIEAYATRAEGLLQISIDRGLEDRKKIETEEDLAPLREREGFRRLVR